MQCIDCHTSNDIHGDGNIYSKREQAVEIECTDCHGNLEEYSDQKTSRGNPIANLEKQNRPNFVSSRELMGTFTLYRRSEHLRIEPLYR